MYGDDDLDLSTQLAINIDAQTDSTHDTPLTVSCTGGHDELVQVLLARGADLEHRDKKGVCACVRVCRHLTEQQRTTAKGFVLCGFCIVLHYAL